MTDHNRSARCIVSFNTIENSTACAVMPDFVGFVNYCYSSSDPLNEN